MTVFTYNHMPGLHTTLKDANQKSAVYTYDGIGRIVNITFDGSRTQSYSYNGMDQVDNESHPETGTIGYTYDTSGNLWQKTRGGSPDTVTLTYSYNTSNQLRTMNDGVETVTYTYDTRGRVEKIQGTGWTRENITYNALGSVKGEAQTVTGLSGAKTLSYTYTRNNNLKTVTYPSGRTVTYTDNDLNMPETVDFNGKSIVSSVVYGIHKKPTSIVVSGNGTAWTTVYNPMGLIDSTSLKKGTSSVYSNSYQYDNVGNVEFMNNAAPDMTAVFSYDELNRLEYASYNNVRNFLYDYDQFGNLKSAKENNTTLFSAVYTNQNRINGGGYGYDNRGNITASPGYTNTWDNRDRLEEIKDPNGDTIGKFLYNERALRLKASRSIPPEAAIVITSPVEGTTWYHNTTNAVTWETTGYIHDLVTILLYRDDDLVTEIVAETASNVGEFLWDIYNDLVPGQYSVRIRTLDNKVEAISGVFTISSVPVQNPFTKVTTGEIVTDSITTFGCNWGDFDNDGDQDLFVANRSLAVPNSLFLNDGDGNFTKAGSSYGALVTNKKYSTGCSWGDFDNDGDLDMFVANNSGGGNYLYMYNHVTGSFSSASSLISSGTGDSRTGAFVDYNNDGNLDIYVSNRNQANYLYKIDDAGGIVRITSGDIVTGIFSLISSSWSDYDNDGDMDLFIAAIDGQKNYLFRNQGDGDFERVLSAGLLTSDTMDSSGGAWADFDNDGFMDILVSNTDSLNYLYRNAGDNTFTRVDDFPADGGNSRGVVWADFDNDSNLDVFVTNRSGLNYLYMNNGYGGFEKVASGPVTTDSQDSLGCAGADIDNDGDIDIFIANASSGSNSLYVNGSQNNGNNWVRIRCTGTVSNAAAIGAKVRVKAYIKGKDLWQMREISGHTSHMSQNSLITHFGLANAGIIEEVHVEWPSGNVQKLSNVAVNQLLTVTEVESPVVNVKTPNGGELFASGSVRDITWASHLIEGNVRIEYSIDDGATYSGVIVSTANSGTYQWTVPPVDSSRCRVRVTGINENADDESNAPFTVSHSETPTLQLLTPNGGEQWETGTLQTISWSSVGLSGCITVEYSIDDGANYTNVIQCTLDDGAYQWTVPGEVSDTCRIRIKEYGGELEDTSDAVFSITEDIVYSNLTVTYPNGGETLVGGETAYIQWGGSGAAEHVKIEVSYSDGLNYKIITTSTANDGSFPWTVVFFELDECKIRVTEIGENGGASDESDGVFSIIDTRPCLTLTAPNGGENWKVGSTQYITWTSEPGIGDVRITYNVDHVTIVTIVESTENDGSFQWVVPDTPSSICTIQVSSGFTVKPDSSDDYFAISTAVEDPFTRVTEGDVVNDGGTSFGCSWGDYDNDGDQDLFVTNFSNEDNILYENQGDGTFTKMTTGSVVTDGGYSLSGSWGDYDNDGDLDLFVPNNLNYDNFLYKNNGDGTFTKMGSEIIIADDNGESRGGSWVDYDNDGDLDLFVPNRNQADFLYRNDGGDTFTKIVSGDLVTDIYSSLAGTWSDFDNDGDQDVFVATYDGQVNRLYRNDGNDVFTPVVLVGEVGLEEMSSSGGSWGDYDNDRDMDLFVCNDGISFLYEQSYYFSENFFKAPYPGDGDEADSRSAVWGDFDNDGDLDLFVANRNGTNRYYRNDGNRFFSALETGGLVTDEGDSLGAACADIDNDGDLDLFVSNASGGNNFLYQNDSESNGNNWVSIKPVGTTGSNRFAVGARIEVEAVINGKSVRQVREISTQTSYVSQNSMSVHFGLGDAAVIDEILVVWPDGDFWVYYNVEVNQFLTLYENVYRDDVNIEVKQGGTDILNGGTFNFGAVSPGIPLDVVFTVSNPGPDYLVFTGLPPVELSGPDVDDFALTVGPAPAIGSGESAAFTIRFNPSVSGDKTAYVTIYSNDPDDNPYIMTLTGSCATGAYRSSRRTTGTEATEAVDVEKSYAASRGDSNSDRFPGPFMVNYENESSSLCQNNSDGAFTKGNTGPVVTMNETGFSNADEFHNAYDTGENRHGPNMEGAVGSMSTPSGTNISGVKTSSLVDTYYLYSLDGKLMAEYDHDGTCVKEYIYMGGKMIAEFQPQTGKYYYYASDQINSTRVVLDETADIVHSSAYGPFGQELNTPNGTFDAKLKFSGKEREGYSDLDYFGARYYDNQSCRFNSIDPIINKKEALSNPQLWNLYAYCRNNPITYFDPDGNLSAKISLVEHALKPGEEIPNNPRGSMGVCRIDQNSIIMRGWVKGKHGIYKPEYQLEINVDIWYYIEGGAKTHEWRHARDMLRAFEKQVDILRADENRVIGAGSESVAFHMQKVFEQVGKNMSAAVNDSISKRDALSLYFGWYELVTSASDWIGGKSNGKGIQRVQTWKQ